MSRLRTAQKRQMRIHVMQGSRHTVAWHPGERHVKVDGEFFSSASVHDDRGICRYPTVVDELHSGECKYNRSREDGHLAGSEHTKRPNQEKALQKAPVRVLTFTSSVVCVAHEIKGLKRDT